MWTFDSLSLLYKELKKKVESIVVPSKLSQLQNDMGFSDRLSELTNDTGFVTAAQAAAAAPVQSVDGRTGAVSTAPFHLTMTAAEFTAQVDALTERGAYTFVCPAGTGGTPETAGLMGMIFSSSASWKSVLATTGGDNANTYRRYKRGGVWSGWVRLADVTEVPGLAPVQSINGKTGAVIGANAVSVQWSTSITISTGRYLHGMLVVDATTVYLLWSAGAGTTQLAAVKVFGADIAGFTTAWSHATQTALISASSSHGWTYFGW